MLSTYCNTSPSVHRGHVVQSVSTEFLSGPAALFLQHVSEGQWTCPIQSRRLIRCHQASVSLCLHEHVRSEWPEQPVPQWPSWQQHQWERGHAKPQRPTRQLPRQGPLSGEVQRRPGAEDQTTDAGACAKRARYWFHDGPSPCSGTGSMWTMPLRSFELNENKDCLHGSWCVGIHMLSNVSDH